VKIYKLAVVGVAVALLFSSGISGCAKKQLKEEGGKVESQKPMEVEKPKEAPGKKGPSEEEMKREAAKEAPPGPKEQPEPVEAARAEKALKDVYYDFDKYDIKPAEAKKLQDNAAWIKANPKVLVTIEGHCDERGTVEYNLALGERRAEAAKRYLISLGVKASRLKTISYGKSKPVDPGHDEAAWAKNRRAHFVVQ
jgi:peptidoglycan-associated lipoprotein